MTMTLGMVVEKALVPTTDSLAWLVLARLLLGSRAAP
jgi:hypothetical protein